MWHPYGPMPGRTEPLVVESASGVRLRLAGSPLPPGGTTPPNPPEPPMSARRQVSALDRKFSWEVTAPLGKPVVPLV